ncbi:CotH protein [Anaerohalosphaera lusitana]|uniref:CotH protein n=1 Tax=Anaerohalosphaera lusitana TaxID=1936003 RepID=A0A1U9NJ99_9BACT|nr:lamin tail domain-containing protein [Anaerohalosphaera lusitana]AQT67877.1 CotH protein [Anaerohalosphaera lusitana]
MKSVHQFFVLGVVFFCSFSMGANCPPGDISGDGWVDMADLEVFAGEWLAGEDSVANISGSGRVDYIDFNVLAGSWGQVCEKVVINEMFFKPDDKLQPMEFVELYNAGQEAVDLSGWYFSDGISYAFPQQTVIGSGEYLVIAQDPEYLSTRYGLSGVLGPYAAKLANEGETVTLRNSFGEKMDEVDYKAESPWPLASVGRDSSMELINPLLDNDLSGSWRASGYYPGLQTANQAKYLVEAQAQGWRCRKGTSEASDPMELWRFLEFVEDGTWFDGKAPVGYDANNDYAINTELSDMRNSYNSAYLRNTFTVSSMQEVFDTPKLRIYVDDGCVVWINGVEVGRFHVGTGDIAYNGTAYNHEASWEEIELTDWANYFNVGAGSAGENVIAIHAINRTSGSSDFVIDAELYVPGEDPSEPSFEPTPGAQNSCYADNAPPQTRQVDHEPQMPATGEQVKVTAKVTDPDGVAAVVLKYQIVSPGDYIPAFLPLTHTELVNTPNKEFEPNPAFEDPANWTSLAMVDDGTGGDEAANDDVYTVMMPPQSDNRTLVRYRIVVTDSKGASVRLPYLDDPSLNYAYYVYDGVPAYTAQSTTVDPDGAPHTYSEAIMNSLPVYSLVTRSKDFSECIAYDSEDRVPSSNEDARDRFNWEGAFVYDGVVHDHIHYRLRGVNQRYAGSGKRSMRVRFNLGHYLQAKDNKGEEFSTKWRTLNIGKACDNLLNQTFFGLNEQMNNKLFNIVGVPAPYMYMFHFRVVDGPDEAPTGVLGQYYGDFYGMYLGMEDYDARFMDAHELADGNLYKLKHMIFNHEEVQRNQGINSVTDGSDFQNIRQNCDPDKDAAWLNRYVDYPHWYKYNTICEMVKHRDYNPSDGWLKNRAWYFEPFVGDGGIGRLRTLPHDSDGSWAHNVWNGNGDYPEEAIYADHPGGDHDDPSNWYYFYYEGTYPPKEEFILEHRNVMREMRDLLWKEDVINPMLDELAAVIAEFVPADRDRWRYGPYSSGSQDWGPMEPRVASMKAFAFTDSNNRASYIDSRCEEPMAQPEKPTVSYTGTAGYPVNDLRFVTSSFSDPQGSQTFAAMKWRIAEITDPMCPAYDPDDKPHYEYNALWESEGVDPTNRTIKVPAAVVDAGHTYRVRCKMQDNTGRWGHWSEPVEFTAGDQQSTAILEGLRVSEVMYNPADADLSKGELDADNDDFEFIELKNVGTQTIDLSNVTISDGVEFAFAGSSVTTLAPGEFVLVVQDEAALLSRYPGVGSLVAGEFANGKLSNGGERIVIDDYWNGVVAEFSYADARGWPIEADGGGHSIVPLPAAISAQNDGALDWGGNWRGSTFIGGSPGFDDPVLNDEVVINEVMAHTDLDDPAYPDHDSNDWIEIYNGGSSSIVLDGNWYLSDTEDDLKKWQLPGVTVAPDGFVSFDEISGFHQDPLGPIGFGLNKVGEKVILSYLPGNGLDRVVDSVLFKGQENDISLGRYPDGGEYLFHMAATRGASNIAPDGGVLISEIMYHPTENSGLDEYIEIYNPTANPVDLWTSEGPWNIDGGVDFVLPAGITLGAGERIVIVGFDPVIETERLADFVGLYGAEGPIFGPWSGNLSNGGERVTLEKALDPDLPDTDIPWYIVDEVIYADCPPWPSDADGVGDSLHRRHTVGTFSGWSPDNWQALSPTPGR